MRIYIVGYIEPVTNKPQAEIVLAGYDAPSDVFVVHRPDGSTIKVGHDAFKATYRQLTRHEAQLVNRTVAELEVMSIQDGDIELSDGSKI